MPYGDTEALRAAVSSQTAAVFLEPTLGEGGVVPPPAGYLQAARQICDASGALLVMDEVQSVGRTGSWYAHQQAGIVPDVVTLAKGLAGGLPIGACIGLGSAASLLQPGDHGSTFGGNPVVCAAALAVIDVIESEGLIGHAAEVGAQLSAGLSACGAPLLKGVRGSGLWLAMTLTEPVAAAAEAWLSRCRLPGQHRRAGHPAARAAAGAHRGRGGPVRAKPCRAVLEITRVTA